MTRFWVLKHVQLEADHFFAASPLARTRNAIAPLKAGTALIGFLLLAACDQEPPSAATDTCGAEFLQDLVGLTKAQLDEKVLPGRTRLVEAGERTIPGYLPDQINIGIDHRGRVDRVFCG